MSVAADSWEADNWPSRKPAAQTKTQKAATRRFERAVEGEARRVVQRGGARVAGKLAAAGAPLGLSAGMSAAYLAAAGLLSYAVTRSIIEANQEGETLPNLVARARSMAATAFQRKLGRRPTREEYADLRKRVGQAIGDHFAAAAGSIPAQWRNFIGLFKGE